MADQVSDARIVAPADYQERETSFEDDMSSWRAGPGWATDRACGTCGNREGNLEIFESWWVSRNGDARENHEIRCARCGMHSLYIVALSPARPGRRLRCGSDPADLGPDRRGRPGWLWR